MNQPLLICKHTKTNHQLYSIDNMSIPWDCQIQTKKTSCTAMNRACKELLCCYLTYIVLISYTLGFILISTIIYIYWLKWTYELRTSKTFNSVWSLMLPREANSNTWLLHKLIYLVLMDDLLYKYILMASLPETWNALTIFFK